MAENIVDQILSAAHSDGEKLLGETQKIQDTESMEKSSELKREMEELLQRGQSQIKATVQQELSTTRLESRRKLQTEKRRLLDQIYEEAWNEITEIDNYRDWLDRQLRTHTENDDKIIVATHERNLFETTFSDLLIAHGVMLSEEVGRFRAGFIVDRGLIRLNCSLDNEFRALASVTEIEISSILFSSD